MKKVIVSLMVVVAFLAVAGNVLAHSGRTDSYGGHMNNSTGIYEYHGLK